MTGALSPELAVAYVRELSADVRAAVVLDADGVRVAGSSELEAPARALAERLDNGAVRVAEGLAVVARTARYTLVAVAGPLALAGPTQLDAAAAVAALDGAAQPPVPPAPEAPPPALAHAARAAIAAA